MKRKKKPSILDTVQFSSPPFRLFLSDLREIVRLSEAKDLKVALTDDEFEYDDIDDLVKERGERAFNLKITVSADGGWKAVEVRFRNDGVNVISQRSDDRLVGLHHEIVDYLKARRPWHANLMRPGVWMIVLLVDEAIYFSDFAKGSRLHEITWAAMPVLLVMMLASFLYQRLSRGVFLQREYQVKGFFERHGERLLVGLIGAVLGAAAAALIK